jgi:hypothetical protein
MWFKKVVQLLRSNMELGRLQRQAAQAGVQFGASQLRDLADAEMAAADEVIEGVYLPNVRWFLSNLDGDRLYGAITYNYQDVNDTFLRGLLLEMVEQRESLPTPAFDRVSLYMIKHFMRYDELTLDEARERVMESVEFWSSGDAELIQSLAAMGRAAFHTHTETLLTQAHDILSGR